MKKVLNLIILTLLPVSNIYAIEVVRCRLDGNALITSKASCQQRTCLMTVHCKHLYSNALNEYADSINARDPSGLLQVLRQKPVSEISKYISSTIKYKIQCKAIGNKCPKPIDCYDRQTSNLFEVAEIVTPRQNTTYQNSTEEPTASAR